MGVVILNVLHNMYWRIRLLVWLSFVTDFIGIFFIVSYAFHQPTNQELQPYFSTIAEIYFYLFAIGILPTLIPGCFGAYIYWIIDKNHSNTHSIKVYIVGVVFLGCCLGIVGIGGFSALLLFMSIQTLDNNIIRQHSFRKMKKQLR